MRWQADLVLTIDELREVPDMDAVIEVAQAFDTGYSSRAIRPGDYPDYVGKILPLLVSADEVLSLGARRILDQTGRAVARRDSQATQKWHREFLLRLEQLR